MQITKKQLQQIIKEEYLRVTPAAAGTLMTEARANYLAEQVLDEGLWDSIKAGFAALKGGAGAAGGKLGDAAGKALAPAVAAVKSAAAGAAKAAGDVSNFVNQINQICCLQFHTQKCFIIPTLNQTYFKLSHILSF